MCTITISDVSINPDGTEISVQGTATQCATVVVTINCSGSPVSANVVVLDGHWNVNFSSASLNEAGCECDELIHVEAVCATNFACSDSWEGPLTCGCQIGIDSVIGTNAILFVHGTALNCLGNQVSVTIQCLDVTGAPVGVPVNQIVPVLGGIWSAQFNDDALHDAGCHCDSHILVDAHCVELPDCADSLDTNISCECTECTFNGPFIQGSNPDGTCAACFVIQCDDATTYQIFWGDGTNTAITPLASGAIANPCHDFLPGNYSVLLLIDFCEVEQIDISIPDCTITNTTTTPLPSCQIQTEVNLDPFLECYEENSLVNVEFTATNLGGVAINNCFWEFLPGVFSDIFPLPPGVPIVRDHDYSAPNSYTAILRVPDCDDINVQFLLPACERTTTTTTDDSVGPTTTTTTGPTTTTTTTTGPTATTTTTTGPTTTTTTASGPTTTTTTATATSTPDSDTNGGFCGSLLCCLLCGLISLILVAFITTTAIGQAIAAIVLGAAYGALTGIFIGLCGLCPWARCTLLGLFLALIVLIVLLLFFPALVVAAAAALLAWAPLFVAALGILGARCL